VPRRRTAAGERSAFLSFGFLRRGVERVRRGQFADFVRAADGGRSIAAGRGGPRVASMAGAGAARGGGRRKTFAGGGGAGGLAGDVAREGDGCAGLSCGAAAGVASAFGAPIGGLLFTIEEGTTHWFRALVWRIFFCTMVASYFTSLLNSGIAGEWGNLGNPGERAA
jgi:hypothetical protein